MNPGDPGVLLNDVLAQADRDTLDDYATDQAETSCAANPSAPPLTISPPFSTPPTHNSSTQSLHIHLRRLPDSLWQLHASGAAAGWERLWSNLMMLSANGGI